MNRMESNRIESNPNQHFPIRFEPLTTTVYVVIFDVYGDRNHCPGCFPKQSNTYLTPLRSRQAVSSKCSAERPDHLNFRISLPTSPPKCIFLMIMESIWKHYIPNKYMQQTSKNSISSHYKKHKQHPTTISTNQTQQLLTNFLFFFFYSLGSSNDFSFPFFAFRSFDWIPFLCRSDLRLIFSSFSVLVSRLSF